MPVTSQDQKLFVKSYFASSVEEAIAAARCDLGPDALLLNTREAPAEAQGLGEIEVIFGKPTPAGAPSEAPAPEAAGEMRREIQEIRAMLTRMGSGRNDRQRHSDMEDRLREAGVDAPLAAEIAEAAWRRASGDTVRSIRQYAIEPEPETLIEALREEIDGRFEVNPELGPVTALVGPPGAGKTSTLVKLAVAEGLARRRAVHFISADGYRIAAADQLRTFAGILGVPFQTVETTLALARAIEAVPENALILIDTPGFSEAALSDSAGELAEFLSSRQEIDTHLVLTASMRPVDTARIARRFDIFRPNRLLFSKMDETDRYGSIFCEAVRSGKPLSFFGSGQLIPEDLARADKATITSSLVLELPHVCQAVA
jgi:flagellar biosynthesis protein FlhF